MRAYASPEDWFEDARDWQKPLIACLRSAILAAGEFEQQINWGNLFFRHAGLCILIRHENEGVLLGFMRGKRLVGIEPRIRPSGKYELGNIVLRVGDDIPVARVTELARVATRLNRELGDPASKSDRPT